MQNPRKSGLRQVERYQRIDLVAFWARRARRLLPNALLVLATTLLVTAAVFPFMQRQVTAQDIIAALLYFSNFRFAERSVDYFDQEVGSSPVLHFWSLSIEEHSADASVQLASTSGRLAIA